MKMIELHAPRYEPAWREGWNARADSECPYGVTQLGRRCAWLAAHRDRYGALAA